jgi:hypothetical protein
MPMQFACPSCKAPLTAPDSAAGKTGPCPKCRATITAPTVTPPTVTSPRPAIGMDGSPDGARQQARVPNSRAPAQQEGVVPDDYFDEGDAATPGDAAPQNTCSCGKPAIAGESLCSECLGEEVKTFARGCVEGLIALIGLVLCLAVVIYTLIAVSACRHTLERIELVLCLALFIYTFNQLSEQLEKERQARREKERQARREKERQARREKERQARLTPEQRIAESARSRFGDATLVQYPSPGYVVVECAPDGVHLGGIRDKAVIDVVKKFKGFVQWAFQVEGVNVVELQGYTLAQDVYGHRACVIRLSIPRHVAARFDWTRATLGGFAQVLQDDPECQAFVHKSGSRGWGLALRVPWKG